MKENIVNLFSFLPVNITFMVLHELLQSIVRSKSNRSKLTRVNSTNVLDEGLWIGGKATTRDSCIEIGTRRTQVHVPAVEDRYILLSI
jgi:hypothetical protein